MATVDLSQNGLLCLRGHVAAQNGLLCLRGHVAAQNGLLCLRGRLRGHVAAQHLLRTAGTISHDVEWTQPLIGNRSCGHAPKTRLRDVAYASSGPLRCCWRSSSRPFFPSRRCTFSCEAVFLKCNRPVLIRTFATPCFCLDESTEVSIRLIRRTATPEEQSPIGSAQSQGATPSNSLRQELENLHDQHFLEPRPQQVCSVHAHARLMGDVKHTRRPCNLRQPATVSRATVSRATCGDLQPSAWAQKRLPLHRPARIAGILARKAPRAR